MFKCASIKNKVIPQTRPILAVFKLQCGDTYVFCTNFQCILQHNFL